MNKLTKSRFFKTITKPIITGIFAIFPLVITIAVILWMVELLKSMLGPETGFGSILQSVGFIFFENETVAYLIGMAVTIGLIYLFGVLVQIGLQKQYNFIIETIVNRIPFINTIYNTSKKVTTLFDARTQPDLKTMSPVMCHFGGHGGTAVLALLTSNDTIEINGSSYYSVLIPTSPIPIGGAILYMPVNWVEKVDIGIDTLLNIYVSMGVSGS